MELKQFNGLNYWLYTPANPAPNKPLVTFLHGAGERGPEPEKIFKISIPKWLRDGRWAPDAYVICPQCPAGFDWNTQVEKLKSVIDHEAEALQSDRSRISITGLSMGGFGTWAMGIHYPRFFSAIAPICGGGLSWRCGNLKEMPVWAFHGEQDTTVPLRNSVEMVDSVNANGGSAKLTVFHTVGHACWDEAYGTTTVLDWLLDQKRTDFEGHKGDANE